MDHKLQKKVRDVIADDVNKMIRNQLRRTGMPFPMMTQVALAHLLAEARRACQFVSLPWAPWVRENIKGLKTQECSQMAYAGESGDPEKFIRGRRERNRKNNVEYRKRNKALAKNSDDVKRRFDGLPLRHKKKFLKDVAEDFPPFDGYDDDTLKLIESIREGLNRDDN
jgi:hypothetical protein